MFTTESVLATVPWVPFSLPTSEGTVLSVFVKAHFTDASYSVLITDLKRVWQEDAGKDLLDRKLKTYAKSFSDTPVAKMLPFIEGFVKAQKANVKYMSFFEPDEAGELKIHATGSVGSVNFRWVFECVQIHSEALPPLPTPGDILHTHVNLPLLTIAIEQNRRIKFLEAMIERKDRELQECHETLGFHTKFTRKRSEVFSRQTFTKTADEEFKSMKLPPSEIPKSFFGKMNEDHLYELAMGKLSSPDTEDQIRVQGDPDQPVDTSSPATGPTLPMVFTTDMFGPGDSQMHAEPPTAAIPVIPELSEAEKEEQRAAEAEQQRIRMEEAAKHRAAQLEKKKKRKIF
ncbi:hypothetical protein PhCBS80983_g01001 [Powellomyces hirtus]|uniref:Non-homologous end-joining factor 1 n=1 Tax=Powellomyces hirtus TaxID=109895 RepID=A0A507ECU0_9FUNG|nr:hypothetical protein PhCBS80983_g01001 [Powellomyces hirtus]